MSDRRRIKMQSKADVFCAQGRTSILFDGTEGGLFEQVGRLLPYIPRPDHLKVQMDDRYAEFDLKQEGIKFLCNGLILEKSKYLKKYLTKIDPETNRYNFYKLIPHNMGARTISLGGSFGRIGASGKDLDTETILKSPAPSCMFWLKYYEKLQQGYQDMTDYIVEETCIDVAESALEVVIEDESESFATELYNKLRQYTKNALTSQLDVSFLTEKCPFTKTQIKNSRKILNSLGLCKSVKEFNEKLLKLIAISPRKIDQYHGQTIQALLATEAATKADQEKIFASIIEREESLILAMEAIVDSSVKKSEARQSPFGNIEISMPTEKEVDMVKGLLSEQLQHKVKQVYRVHAVKQQEKYDIYKEKNHITETKMLWHGSKNGATSSHLKRMCAA